MRDIAGRSEHSVYQFGGPGFSHYLGSPQSRSGKTCGRGWGVASSLIALQGY